MQNNYQLCGRMPGILRDRIKREAPTNKTQTNVKCETRSAQNTKNRKWQKRFVIVFIYALYSIHTIHLGFYIAVGQCRLTLTLTTRKLYQECPPNRSSTIRRTFRTLRSALPDENVR